jgi:hypothetical protein
LDHPLIDFIDAKLLFALEREPFHSAHSLAKIGGVSYFTIIRHLRDSLGMRNFHLGWVQHNLTPKLHRR